MDPMTNMPIVVLKDVTGDAVLPIWVGIYEANAIALEIEKVTTPRPDDTRPDQSAADGVGYGDQEGCGERVERRYLLRADLAGAGRAIDQRGFEAERCISSSAAA